MRLPEKSAPGRVPEGAHDASGRPDVKPDFASRPGSHRGGGKAPCRTRTAGAGIAEQAGTAASAGQTGASRSATPPRRRPRSSPAGFPARSSGPLEAGRCVATGCPSRGPAKSAAGTRVQLALERGSFAQPHQSAPNPDRGQRRGTRSSSTGGGSQSRRSCTPWARSGRGSRPTRSKKIPKTRSESSQTLRRDRICRATDAPAEIGEAKRNGGSYAARYRQPSQPRRELARLRGEKLARRGRRSANRGIGGPPARRPLPEPAACTDRTQPAAGTGGKS